MGKVISIISGEKGGTGKTTVSYLLTFEGAMYNIPIAYIDMSYDMNYTINLFLTSFPDVKRRVFYGVFDYLLGRINSLGQVALTIMMRPYPLILPAVGWENGRQVLTPDAVEIYGMKIFPRLARIARGLANRGYHVIIDFPASVLSSQVYSILNDSDTVLFVAEGSREVLKYAENAIERLRKDWFIKDLVLAINKVHGISENELRSYIANTRARDWFWIRYFTKGTGGRSLPDVIFRAFFVYIQFDDDSVIKQIEAELLPYGFGRVANILLR